MSREKTEEKVFSYMEQHHMLEPKDVVVTGVSGGADSVCLLFLLLEYAKRVAPITIEAVHVHHGIRKDADRDAAYVEKLCKENGVGFSLMKYDIPKLSKDWGISEEEAGREARYEAFTSVANRFKEAGKSCKIAVAHHVGDRAETFLFHLFRGSGLKGLGSIRPVRDEIVRPLLCLERQEIEEYLAERGISYCQDSTNEEDHYTRNRIRHHILPYAEEQVCEGAARHIANSAAMLAETEDYLAFQTHQAMEGCTVFEKAADSKDEATDRILISLSKFLENHSLIRKRILHYCLSELAPGRKDISSVHVELLAELAEKGSGKHLDFPYGIRAESEQGRLLLKRVDNKTENVDQDFPRILLSKEELCQGPTEVSFLGQTFEIQVLDLCQAMEKYGNIPQNQYTKWFDYDKIIECPVLRTRRQGDYFLIRNKEGQSSHKTLKDYMITEKIPRSERDRVPVFAADDQVIWLVGYRIGENYKVDDKTKKIIMIKKTEDEKWQSTLE